MTTDRADAISNPRAPSSHRRPELDGLRTVAVLAVFAFHCVQPSGAGLLGVDVFFVLSGYLMTTLVAREVRLHDGVRWGRYISRRLRRLYPALAMAVVLAIVLALLTGTAVRTTIIQAPFALTYLKDGMRLRGGLLDHTWSLSVEAQFYLVWPLVMVWVMRARNPAKVLWVSVAAGLALPIALLPIVSSRGLYFTPIGHLAALLAGSAVALTNWDLGRRGVLAANWSLAALVVLLLEPVRVIYRPGGELAGMIVASAITAAMLLAFNEGGQHSAASRILSWAPLAAIGLRSYGFYLYHQPILLVCLALMPRVLAIPLALAATLALSWISWAVVETRFHHPGAASRSAATDATPMIEGRRVKDVEHCLDHDAQHKQDTGEAESQRLTY